ncbi:uncharacterized protein LOC125070626 [Vanessa atalanta]|uniref:uncharacterized protein LOC125070626 n=1 Tax=Vanessa atalanta TaxID=42275 RepID=UPI001FCD0AB9|nr:uncharacterized protein LOC125070626 [Vanessa atalanta]
MKSIILLSILALTSGAKLNRAYLPPEHAQSSSGSEFLEAPISQPIVVDEDVVYHKSSGEINGINANQQQINGFIQIGSHGSSFAHGTEAHENAHYHGQNLNVVQERPERTQAANERHAAVLRQEYESDGQGYAYAYETENGIYGEENGVAKNGVIAEGAYSYTGDDGIQYTIKYTADENGFRPHGDHLPTPPPIPEEILKSLEQNARDEAAGIYDDGSYDEEKYGEKAEYNINHGNHGIEQQANIVVHDDHDHIANAEEGNPIVTDAILVPEPHLQRPIFRNPTLGQHVIVNIPVNKSYLPPIHQQTIEDRSSEGGKPVFGTKNRQHSFNSKSGYKY